jgi:hypothetical protein
VLVDVVQYHKNIREKISTSRDEDKGEKKNQEAGNDWGYKLKNTTIYGSRTITQVILVDLYLLNSRQDT